MSTAEEFLQGEECVLNDHYPTEYITKKMKKYAEFHVKQALKRAAKKATLSLYKKSLYSKTPRWKRASKEDLKKGIDLFSYEVLYKPSKTSIISSYPISNIK